MLELLNRLGNWCLNTFKNTSVYPRPVMQEVRHESVTNTHDKTKSRK